MNDKYYKMVAISDKVSIRVPKGLTRKAEAQYIAEYKATYMKDFDKEYQEWKDMVEGRTPLMSLGDLLQEIRNDESEDKKESA